MPRQTKTPDPALGAQQSKRFSSLQFDPPPTTQSTALCPACGPTVWHKLLTVRGTELRQCSRCGLATWDWKTFDFEAFYGQDYWQSTELGKGYADYFTLAPAMRRTHAKRLAWITRHLFPRAACPLSAPASPIPPRRLLDAGCGPGFFVQAVSGAGWEACGVEVSAFAARFAREELRQKVWQGRIEPGMLEADPTVQSQASFQPYDAVTLWDVIEHLPDPAGALQAIAQVTRPGGVLALSTGDVRSLMARLSGARWHLFTLPEHLWFFTSASLRRLLEQSGFEVIDQGYEVCWYSLRYLIERLESMARLGRPISPRLGPLGKIPLPVTLLDIVTILARKKT